MVHTALVLPSEPLGHRDLAPVSYTHLDVYKRQVLSRGHAKGNPGGGDPSGSFPLVDRPEGLENCPQRDSQVSLGE